MAVMWRFNNRILICSEKKVSWSVKKTSIFIYFAICYRVFEL